MPRKIILRRLSQQTVSRGHKQYDSPSVQPSDHSVPAISEDGLSNPTGAGAKDVIAIHMRQAKHMIFSLNTRVHSFSSGVSSSASLLMASWRRPFVADFIALLCLAGYNDTLLLVVDGYDIRAYDQLV